jgi:hypothetical protein
MIKLTQINTHKVEKNLQKGNFLFITCNNEIQTKNKKKTKNPDPYADDHGAR